MLCRDTQLETAVEVAKAVIVERQEQSFLLALVSKVQGRVVSFEFLADTVTASLKGCHSAEGARF
jgi:hypothetical protein